MSRGATFVSPGYRGRSKTAGADAPRVRASITVPSPPPATERLPFTTGTPGSIHRLRSRRFAPCPALWRPAPSVTTPDRRRFLFDCAGDGMYAERELSIFLTSRGPRAPAPALPPRMREEGRLSRDFRGRVFRAAPRPRAGRRLGDRPRSAPHPRRRFERRHPPPAACHACSRSSFPVSTSGG